MSTNTFFGKENLMASFNHWLMETIPGGYLGIAPLSAGKEFFWSFDFPIMPQYTPAISTTEVGLFNLGEIAFDRLVAFDVDGDAIYGTVNQTLIEIACVDQDKSNYTSATKIVRNLRDRVVNALTDTLTLPLKDYNNPVKPQIGVISLDPSSNSINEKFIVDPQNQNVKRYVLLIRVFWAELTQRTKTKAISSITEIV